MIRLIETNVMRGPNQWSTDQTRLIVARFDAENLPASAEQDFLTQVLYRFPGASSDANHIALPNAVESLVKHLVVHLQLLAGMACDYCRLRQTLSPGQFLVLFEFQSEIPGVYAAEAAEAIVNALLKGNDPEVNRHVAELERLNKKYGIGPTTTYILDEVKKRDIPFRQFEHGSLITLGYGNRQKKIRTAVTDATSGLGIEMAGDKDETKRILADAHVPVPQGIIVYSEEELRRRLSDVRFPVVLKPLDGNHGRGVTTDIHSLERALFGYGVARRISRPVIIEEYVKGDDYRFLVINYRLVAVALRLPAHVTGDGRSTIRQLIDKENEDPQRGDSSEHVLALIKVDEVTTKILNEKGLMPDSVLPNNERLVLKDTANISAGGTAIDVTDKVHPENRFMAERIARLFNLDICGIDIVATAVDVPVTRDVGAVIEVNAGPGLRMHSNPQHGVHRDVASPIIEMLFPNAAASRIPVVAVTGTNGKTTTTRLLAHMAKVAGYMPGFCVSDGIYINGHLIFEGDCTGAISAQQVLFDPTIDFAVLECARGGIIRSGLGFAQCDVSILTNIGEDHLGMKDIHTVDDMTRVKAVVPRSTRESGLAVLNADDNRVYGLYESLSSRIGLFSLAPHSDRIQSHIRSGGIAAVIEDGAIVAYDNSRIYIEKLENIPLTYGGSAAFMVQNVLAATLAGIGCGFDPSVIRNALQTFGPSPENTPGRLNLFDFGNFRVMVDYVHNAEGFKEVKKFLATTSHGIKTAIVSVAGDRRDEDIRAAGMVCATTFDRLITRDDHDLRGRSPGESAALVAAGVRHIDPAMPCEHIADGDEAIRTALSRANDNELVFICADKVKHTLELIEAFREEHLAQRV
jgi:cyanophycin synthetase